MPADVTRSTDAGQADGVRSATATLGTATATDNVGVASLDAHGRAGREPLPDRRDDDHAGRRPTSSATRPSTTQKVTVVDTEKPVLAVPPHVTPPDRRHRHLRRRSPTPSSAPRRATDNSGSVTIVRSGVPAGNVFPVGTTTITYTATDAAGNVTTATQTVTVTRQAPVVTVAVDRRERQRVPARPDRLHVTRTVNVLDPVVDQPRLGRHGEPRHRLHGHRRPAARSRERHDADARGRRRERDDHRDARRRHDRRERRDRAS